MKWKSVGFTVPWFGVTLIGFAVCETFTTVVFLQLCPVISVLEGLKHRKLKKKIDLNLNQQLVVTHGINGKTVHWYLF